MDRRARLAAAVAGRPVDRVPVSAWGHFFRDEVRLDSFVDRMVGFRDAWDWDVFKVHARASYHVEPFGWRYEPSTSAATGHACTFSPVRTPEDWLRLRPAPVDAPAFVEQLAALEAIRRRTPADVPLIMTVFTPLDVADKMLDRDAARLAEHIRQAPEAVAYGLSVFAATLEPFVRRVAALVNGIYFSTKWVNAAKLAPAAYRKLALAADLHMMAPAANLPFNLMHVCENEVFLDGFADYPVAIMHWDDNGAHNPSLRAGHVMTGRAVGGGVDAATLAAGTPAEVTEKAVRAIVGMGGTGMLLGPGCSLRTAATPEANLRALRDAPLEAALRLAGDRAA